MGSPYHEVIVCYDVEDDKHRKKLSDDLKNIGLISIQKSVSWGHITQAEHKAALALFKKHLKGDSDKAFIVNAPLRKSLKDNSLGYEHFELPDFQTNETF